MNLVNKSILVGLACTVLFCTPVYAKDSQQPDVCEEDIEVLSHVINGEAGANYCSDTLMYYVGSVVLNRVKHEQFPNTIKDVVFQKGQYSCTKDGNYSLEPCDRAKRIAKELLIEGSRLPEHVVFQSQHNRGNVYCKEQNMYFCSIE